MNTKTLLAFSCLLAAAQALPAAIPSSSSCSVSCSGRNFWTGYESGTTLQYAFEQKVELSSGLSQQKSVLMQVTGQASVEVHGKCEMMLTVDVQGVKSSKSPSDAMSLNSKELPKAMVDALKEPLRFSFEDGRIGSMCPSSSETRASLNFKRGLLSQLQLSIDRPDQEATVREDDVLGNCWTVYKQLGSNKVEKTKDLSSCTSNFEVFPRKGVKFEAPERNSQWPTVVQGNLKCIIELDSESMVIKENLCEENRVLENNLGEKGLGERIKVITSLKFQRKTSSLVGVLFEVRDRSDLKHSHKTGDNCHDSKVWFEEEIFHSGNECLEKKLPSTGTASSDFKALAKKTVEELCEETKSNNMLNSTAAKFADLVKYLRGITSQEDFAELFNWVKNGYCSENSMLKVMFYSAIPNVGTRQSIQIILNQLKNNDGMSSDASTANWLVSGIAMMPHPTPEIITDVLEFTKRAKEESMLIISKDQPLALSAVTGQYCGMNSNCESNEAVSAVLSFFSESMGANCTNLESQDDPSVFDYAFAALLSIGNIGRATGGASSIIGCAENSKISLANRAFAIRSLRRFPDLSTSEKMRLGRIIISKELDSELRITAYQAVARYASASFWSDERVISKLSDLMQDEREDQQVQLYIYSHLSQWMRKQRRSTDSYTVSNILRDYEKVMMKSKLSGLQASNYWARQFKNPSSKSKLDLESNIIYSSKSILPRFVNFNFTVETPFSGEAINMMEFGLRMEGMESTMEQVFNAMNKEDDSSDELVRKRRQASLELSDEQKLYKQGAPKQRLDFYTRKNGMELTHNNFDETILGVVPQFLKTIDFANVKGLAGEKISSINMDTVGQAAGTMVESTISIPTISGFPILMKKEMHYLTNIGFKQNFDMPSMMEVNMGMEVQPTVSIHMARTVTVDSGFERAGIRSRTSGLSSIGVKLSMEGNFKNPNDVLFSYKVDPLKKQQKILELKTDIMFMQHSGPSNVIESPVVSPSELTPVTSKCFTPASVKLFGRRMCLETNFDRTYNPLGFVRQNPGSFRLYIDKDDALGVYEATFKFKKEGKNYDVQAILGDQSSTDRHAKFQFILNKSSGTRKIVLELANPVLPIKWVSESKPSGDDFDVTVDLKFGSTDYAFSGKRSKDPEGGWKLDGNFYRKDKERQRMNIVTRFENFGLPLFRFDLTATTPSNDKLTFNQLFNYKSGKLELSFLASHEKSGSVVTSIKSRLQCSKMERGTAGQTRAFLYDTEVVNKNGKNFLHTFSAKVDRKRKDAADTWESAVVVSHKFKYGVTKSNSVLDFDANLQLEEVIKPMQMYKATGSGSLDFESDSGRKTAKLTNFRLVLGESDVIDDHFNTKTFLLEYATELDGSKSDALMAMQALPLKKWRSDNQCLYFKLKASRTVGAELQTHAFEVRHTSSVDSEFKESYYKFPTILQVVKVVYANKVLLDTTHKYYPITLTQASGDASKYIFGHFLNITTYDEQTYFINNKYSVEGSGTTTLGISSTVTVNQVMQLQLNQSMVVDTEVRGVDYKLKYQRPDTMGSVRIYSQNSGYKECRRKAAEVAKYMRGLPKGGFNMKKFLGLIKQFIYEIKVESGFEMNIPSMNVQATNYIDMTVTNGVMMNITRVVKSDGIFRRRSFQLAKEVDVSAEYRRIYKLNVQRDEVESLFKSEIVCTKSSNPKLKISLSKVSIAGSQSPDFNLTTVGQLFPQFQRENQAAFQLNVTYQMGEIVEKSNLNIVVDTAPWKVLNPALNVSLAVTSANSGSLNIFYNFGVQKSELGRRSIKKIKSVTSKLTIDNTLPTIPFASYIGLTTFSTSRDQPFDFKFIKTLDESDIINIQTTLNSEMLYIGMKSDSLPAKEVSYTAKYKQESNGYMSYLSQIRLNALSLDLTIKDNGTFKLSGRSGKVLFSTIYSGNIQIIGLDQLIDSSIQIDRLDYSGKLEAKTTGEFDSSFMFAKVLGTTSENLGLVSTKLNYWPFEISAQIKTPFWNIDHYGFNVSAGIESPENGFRFKTWIASPGKQSSLRYWHTYTQAQKHIVTGHTMVKSDHLFTLKSDQIISTFTAQVSTLYDYTVFMNVSTPFKPLELMQWDIVQNDMKQMAVFTIKSNDKQQKMINFERNAWTSDDGTKLANGTFMVNSLWPELTGWNKVAFTGDSVIGSDYLWGWEFSKNDAKMVAINILWLKSGNTYPQLSRLSVPGANLGFDVKVFDEGVTGVQVYLLRSGDAAKTQWEMRYKADADVQTKVELTNGKVTSGTGEAFGKSITFSSPSDGVIDVKVASTEGTNTITWTSKMDGSVLGSLEMKFSFDGKESCINYAKEAQKVNIQYGSCSTPNTFTVTYQFENIWNVNKAKIQLNAEHQTTMAANMNFNILPGVSIPLISSGYPFKLNIDMNNELMQGNIGFNSTGGPSVMFIQDYDLSSFPEKMKFKRILKIGSSQLQTFIINYDTKSKTVDVRLETNNLFKIIVTKKELSVEASGIFTAGVTYSTEASTEKKMIEMKGELNPTPAGQPCILRLWKSKIEGGSRYAIEFVQHSSKDISIVSDVTNFKYTNAEFAMDVATTLSSTLFEKLRSANSVLSISMLRDLDNNNYTLEYKESFTAGGIVYYELESVFRGREKAFPSTMKIEFPRGYLESEFSYNFNPEYDSESYLRWSLSKFGESRDSYLTEYRTKDVSNHIGKFWRDFSLEISSPRRQMYLSESCTVFANGTVQTELQAFLNKRNFEGIVLVLNKDFTQTNVYKRSLQMTLPTRQIGYERVLKVDGKKLGYNITIFWDMNSEMEKRVTIEFNREKERRPSGYYYYHRLDMTAPFLKNKVTKEVLYERKENEFQLSLTHTIESDDKVTLKVNGIKNWDSSRSAFQKEMNISFTQQKGDVNANLRITVDSAKQTRSKIFSRSKYLTVINFYTTVPSLSIDSHVRIRSVPFEEFTYACNHGATLSFRYYKGYARSRMSLFVSNSKKEAGQLTVVRDWLMSTWQATLDTGKGYMDPKSTLSFPFYEPAKVMVKVSAGLSGNGKKVHFGIINGAMGVKDTIMLWKPETVPADLDFFFVGMKLKKDNTMSYASHWRIRQTNKSPFTYAKEVLVDPWAKVENLPVGTETINKLLKPFARSKSNNIDTDVVLDMLTSIASNDIDSLKRWAAKAKENNQFLSNTIGDALTSGFYIVKGAVENWAESVKNLSYEDALPADLGILSGISKLSDATANALSKIPIAKAWSITLTMMKYGSDQFSYYFSSYINELDRKISEKVSSLTGGQGSSVLAMFYNAVSSVFPVKQMCQKFSIIVEEYVVGLLTADVELATQVGNAVQPFLINTLAEIPKVYDFIDNLAYEINQWGVYISSLAQALVKDNAEEIENNIPGQTVYTKNVATSFGRLLVGDYSGAIRQFFNTNVNKVNVWRVPCDQACLDSGSFAAINGTLYVPFDLSAINFKYRPGRYTPPYNAMMRYRYRGKYGRQKLQDALQELNSDRNIGGVIKRMISPKHRTAEASGSYIKTFGGKELRNLSPCRYLLAHDFLNGDFSVYQTYTWNGKSRQRGDLLVRFYNMQATITNSNELQLNGAAVTLPVTRTFGDQSVAAKSRDDKISVKFNSELQNALEIKCRRSSNSCSIRVHPLYHGRLNGALGNNDGNSANDLHGGSASEHMRLWNAGSCVMS